MERSKQDVNIFRAPKLPSVRRSAGLAMRCLANATADLWRDRRKPRATRLILGAVVFIVLFNVVHLGLRLVWRIMLTAWAWRLFHSLKQYQKSRPCGVYRWDDGDRRAGATYVRLSTTLEITAGDAVVSYRLMLSTN